MSKYLLIGALADLPGVENRPETAMKRFRKPNGYPVGSAAVSAKLR